MAAQSTVTRASSPPRRLAVHARVVRAKRKDLYSFPAGQVVGMLTEETSVRDVMVRMQMEYLDTMERLHKLTPV